MVIETPRLLLRPFTEDDVGALAAIYANPDVMRFLAGGQVFDRAQTWRSVALFLGHQVMRGYSILAVVEKSSGRLLGRSGPWYPEGWPALEVGWVIDRARWGEGFATEAGRASLDYCYSALGATEVVSIIHPDNERSAHVALRLGARRDRQMRDFLGVPVVDVYVHHRP